jgi:hypothetical protein
MTTIKPWALGAAVAVFALNFSSVCMGGTLAATPSLSGKTVAFVAQKAYSSGTLTVVGPNGFAATVVSKRGLPSLSLALVGALPDGQYTYQLNAATSQVDTSVVMQNNGRLKKNNVRPRVGVGLSGMFQVKGGSIVVAPLAAAVSRGRGDRDQD